MQTPFRPSALYSLLTVLLIEGLALMLIADTVEGPMGEDGSSSTLCEARRPTMKTRLSNLAPTGGNGFNGGQE